jgi:Sugar (and other) transporter
MLPDRFGVAAYGRFLIVIAGFGGLLYGIDVGIIAAALLYLSKTVSLTLGQTSIIVAAVLGGSMFSSVIAGLLADWLGRRSFYPQSETTVCMSCSSSGPRARRSTSSSPCFSCRRPGARHSKRSRSSSNPRRAKPSPKPSSQCLHLFPLLARNQDRFYM